LGYTLTTFWMLPKWNMADRPYHELRSVKQHLYIVIQLQYYDNWQVSIHSSDMHSVPHSRNAWQWKSLANLATHPWFAKLIINILITIHQTLLFQSLLILGTRPTLTPPNSPAIQYECPAIFYAKLYYNQALYLKT